MGPTIIILAAGTAERWTGPVNKLLLEIDGEPLLTRTIRMCRRRIAQCYKSRADLHVMVNERGLPIPLDAETHVAEDSWSTCSTLMSSRKFWKGAATVVLLGDVLYTQWALETALFSHNPDPWFLGTPSEIHALRFSRRDYDLIPEFLQPVIFRAKDINNPAQARLWHFYRRLTSTPPEPHVKPDKFFEIAPSGRESRDFDHYDDYIQWCFENRP